MNNQMIKIYQTLTSKLSQLSKDKRGATMVEYAILLFLILVIAAAIFRTLGSSVCGAGSSSVQQFTH